MAKAAAEAVKAPHLAKRLWQWNEWGAGCNASLSKDCERELNLLLQVHRGLNGAAWLRKTSPPDPETTVYIWNDSAGTSGKDADAVRAAACWAWSPRADFGNCRWVQEVWDNKTLATLHSTQEEMANGVANAEWALQAFPWAECLIEVYDSKSSTFLLRKMSCRADNQANIILERQKLSRKMTRGQRIATLWADRMKGQVPDMLSKFEMADARKEVLRRFPQQPLQASASKRPRNCLNCNAQ
jgi:hypothetical protein